MLCLLPVVLALSAAPPAAHDNALFQELTAAGVKVGAARAVPIMKPWLADGADAKAQREAVLRAVGDQHPWDDFVRKSPVAQHVIKATELKSDAADVTVHAIDLAFVAHGPVAAFADGEFRGRLFKSRSDTKSKVLGEAELAKRGLTAARRDRGEEAYAFAEFEVMEKVQLRGVNHTILSARDESIVMASRVAPAFTGDAEFPNQWRAVRRDPDGTTRLGPPQDYAGYGWYLKVTRLHEPAGALFAEFHLVYAEPKGWFGGANLLRSKVPITAQTEVRALRRELARYKL